jgi:hypothetical protein
LYSIQTKLLQRFFGHGGKSRDFAPNRLSALAVI